MMSGGDVGFCKGVLGRGGEARGPSAASGWGCGCVGGQEGVMGKVGMVVVVEEDSISILSGNGRNWFDRLLPLDCFFFLVELVEGGGGASLPPVPPSSTPSPP